MNREKTIIEERKKWDKKGGIDHILTLLLSLGFVFLIGTN
jgi:hypothetical protein